MGFYQVTTDLLHGLMGRVRVALHLMKNEIQTRTEFQPLPSSRACLLPSCGQVAGVPWALRTQ